MASAEVPGIYRPRHPERTAFYRLLSAHLSRCAYESVRRTWAMGFEVPGMVASIQTFGSYANFHPHIHALVTNAVMTPEGELRLARCSLGSRPSSHRTTGEDQVALLASK